MPKPANQTSDSGTSETPTTSGYTDDNILPEEKKKKINYCDIRRRADVTVTVRPQATGRPPSLCPHHTRLGFLLFSFDIPVVL